ncbi:MAG TPA: carbohydrate kinase family protein [Candidatus Dormibacteraeota bacterium]|nr:carbohydrate kinase family protein [Candidatus Dormibacteraeota bacterium]
MHRVAVTGSVAYDTIMVFPGRFREHILPDHTHMLNVSFQVDRLEQRRGGTAANISYTLALLGEQPLLCASVGAHDFDDYEGVLRAAGVDTTTVLRCDDVPTAAAFITTDLDDNQITAFYAGAMSRAAGVDLSGLDVECIVVAPDAPDAIALHIEQASQQNKRLLFAPAQQIPSLPVETLLAGLDAAWLVVGNDYELNLISERTGRRLSDMRRSSMLAVTHGGEGSALHTADGTFEVPIAPAQAVVDPTGAGDAYIAGLLSALLRDAPPEVAGRVGAVAAAYAVEQRGPQTHTFTHEQFRARFHEAFGEDLPHGIAA